MSSPVLLEPLVLAQHLGVWAHRRFLLETSLEKVYEEVRTAVWQWRHVVLHNAEHD